MHQPNQQHGVGLIEVLVAVLLLSVAVLGFSALQMRAVTATDESLVRTKSLTIVRNLAEVMRAYPEAYVVPSGTAFTSAVSTTTEEQPAVGTAAPIVISAQPTIQAVIASITETSAVETSVTVDSTSISTISCIATACNINQLVAREALLIQQTAVEEDIDIAIITCPGTTSEAIQRQMCIVTAWNNTKALLDDDDDDACAGTTGIYKTGSQCLISEAY